MKGQQKKETMTYYIRSWEIAERRLDGSLILLDLETEAIFHLNRLGEIIWECMRQPVCKADIIAACRTNNSDIPLAILERDVNQLLEHLLLRRIIQLHSGVTPCPAKIQAESSA